MDSELVSALLSGLNLILVSFLTYRLRMLEVAEAYHRRVCSERRELDHG